MPWIIRRFTPAAWRRIPWPMVWAAALWLFRKGRDRVDSNLSKREQKEFRDIVVRSKGRPGTLRQRDRTRLKNLAGKAIRG